MPTGDQQQQQQHQQGSSSAEWLRPDGLVSVLTSALAPGQYSQMVRELGLDLLRELQGLVMGDVQTHAVSQVKSSQVKSSQVNSSQVNSSQVNSSQVKSTQVNSSQVKSSQVK
jgi:hypothetical protein